ncbi:MAG: hypothetical protein ACI89D_000446 [Bermanella sp.]|jgi:hypothetical protein
MQEQNPANRTLLEDTMLSVVRSFVTGPVALGLIF